NQPQAKAEVAVNTTASQKLAFGISGSGMLAEEGAGSPEAGGADARDSRPGGGLGPPIDAPDPLEKYRWYILGGFAVLLLAGGIYIAKRPRPVLATAGYPGQELESAELSAPLPAPRSRTQSQPNMLLEALKEELFQLEIEHKQGNLSQEE